MDSYAYLRVGDREMLFNKYSILDVLPAQKQKLKEKIQSFKADDLLSASEQDLVVSLVEEFTLNAPTIDESKIEMDYRDKQIDVSGDHNRIFSTKLGHFMLQGANSRSFSRSAETPPSSMCSRRISRIAYLVRELKSATMRSV